MSFCICVSKLLELTVVCCPEWGRGLNFLHFMECSTFSELSYSGTPYSFQYQHLQAFSTEAGKVQFPKLKDVGMSELSLEIPPGCRFLGLIHAKPFQLGVESYRTPSRSLQIFLTYLPSNRLESVFNQYGTKINKQNNPQISIGSHIFPNIIFLY